MDDLLQVVVGLPLFLFCLAWPVRFVADLGRAQQWLSLLSLALMFALWPRVFG